MENTLLQSDLSPIIVSPFSKMSAPTNVLSKEQQNQSLRVNNDEKKKKKSSSSGKNVLHSPFNDSWPFIPEELELKILSLLKESFPLRLVPKFCSNKERKMFTKQQKENKLSDEQNEELKIRKQIRSELALGINCVTRALEKDELRLVIITRESKVGVLVNHILPLVTVRHCPAIRLPNLSENMYNVVGIQSLAALGFRKTKEKSMFDDFVNMVIETAPPIKSSWLQEGESKTEFTTMDTIIETAPGEVSDTARKSVVPEISFNPETSNKVQPVLKKDYSYLYVYKKDQKLGDDFISLSSNIKTDEDYFPTEPKKSKSEQTSLVSMKYKGVKVQAMKKNEKRKKKKKKK